MLTISNISKSYIDRVLFTGVSFSIGARERIAIIGPNGSGKTTLFEIIAGNVTPDAGSVSIGKGITTGYLAQDIKPASKRCLLDDVTSSSSKISGLEHRIKVLYEELADERETENSTELLHELGELQHKFEAAGGYDAEYEAKTILSGLGFAESDFNRPLIDFSGGWLMRAELAKLLFLNPDLLLLDEPTNHLDLESCIWFEHYLNTYQGAVLVTSHDRAFLNRVVKKVLAIEPDEVLFHFGNYDGFIEARQKELEFKEAAAKRQQVKIDKEMRFIERFRYKASKATQVQSRVKRLEKIERIVVPRATRKIHFSFPTPPRIGEEVIALKHVHKSYGSNVVYDDLNLVLNRGDKAALVGPNGAGKTTLLRILAGVLPFEKGERKLGYNARMAYYAQYVLELLSPDNNGLDELRMVAQEESEQSLRGMLGAFLFNGDDVFKTVSVLSGGEKSRLAIAKMLTQPANFLLMDEPTNHLDIPSREMLTDAFEAYRGTLCFITHDETLIRQIANKIVDVRSGEIVVFQGDYDSYLYWRDSSRGSNPDAPQLPEAKAVAENIGRDGRRKRKLAEGELRNTYYRQIAPTRKRIVEIETKLAEYDSQLSQAKDLLSSSEQYGDSTRAVEVVNEYQRLEVATKALTEEWEKLSTEAERITQEFENAKSDM
ncbi:MAG: ABC-F family ATP-binding cassette domain-containing protein [Dehalococcoidales bacterium]|jgi:ATP-binding cassette subfamily F protein 3|nr:ABC-F family ATP-binding cassette domain-containing protein [Dehalococcoidales bacterium]